MKIKNARQLLDLAIEAALDKEDDALWYQLSRLAEVASVKLTDGISTAAIKKVGEQYHLRFSPTFVEKHLHTAEDVLFVLLHELMHKIRGDHLRDLPLESRLDYFVANFVEDMLINASLCSSFFPEPVQLFNSLYRTDSFPDVLLLPPANFLGLHPGRALNVPGEKRDPFFNETMEIFYTDGASLFEKLDHLPELTPSIQSRFSSPESIGKILAFIYIRAWLLWGWDTVESLYEDLRLLFPENVELLLLGDHGDTEGDFEEWDEVLGRKSAGFSEDEWEKQIEVEDPGPGVNRVARLLRRLLEPDPLNPREGVLLHPDRSLIPWPGRREMLWLSRGLWPVFFRTPTFSQDYDGLRPHIYIDVSASTRSTQPRIYGLILRLADIIGQPLFLFSNIVAEVSLEDIRSGRTRTTGGTDLDCVIHHALANHFRKIIVITDGDASLEDHNAARALAAGLQIYLLLTNSIDLPENIAKIASSIEKL